LLSGHPRHPTEGECRPQADLPAEAELRESPVTQQGEHLED